jgi:hypothetical protein
VQLQAIDISALCVHPACVVSITLTCLRTESCAANKRDQAESLIVNVSGRLLLVQQVCASPDAENTSTTLVTIFLLFARTQIHISTSVVVLEGGTDGVGVVRRERLDAAQESKGQTTLNRGPVAILRSARHEGVAASFPPRRRQGAHVHVQKDHAPVPAQNLSSR